MQKFAYVRHNKETEILIDFLCRRFPYQSRVGWIDAIQRGSIGVNGKSAFPEYLLKTKDIVSYDRPREAEPEIDANYKIFHVDDEILVVEKSGNIPISESGKFYRNTLLNILKEKENFKELFAVHRLDRETSGVLVIARTKRIATILGEQFLKRSPKKTYHAILVGEMVEKENWVDRPICKVLPTPGCIRIRQVVSDSGKPSKTLFKRVLTCEGLTLAEIETFTGRTHQIRCHAEYLGYPILGDKLYGQSDKRFIQLRKDEEKPEFPPFGLISRQLLHASSLTFTHPERNQLMTFESSYLDEFGQFAKHPSIKGLLYS